MRFIKRHGRGVIVYSYQEGRGIGIEKKIKEMEIQRTKGYDTVEAFKKLKLTKLDYRDYNESIDAFKDLRVSRKIMSFSDNPRKIKKLEGAGKLV